MIIVWMIVDLHPFTTVVFVYYWLFFVHQGTRVQKRTSSRHGTATKAKRISCPSCIPQCIRLTHNSDQNGLPQTIRHPMSQTSRQPMFFLSQGLCTLLPTCFFNICIYSAEIGLEDYFGHFSVSMLVGKFVNKPSDSRFPVNSPNSMFTPQTSHHNP